MNKQQLLFNDFYLLKENVKKDKCLRLDKDDILNIYNALSLLDGVDIDIAKKSYEDWIKEI